MQSIDRAMGIIKILVSNSESGLLPITELAKECKLPVSSMHRLLKAMEKHELVQQDTQTKHYGLGNIWLEYGLRLYDSMDYISKIRPEIEKLVHTVNESVYLSKPMGKEALIIERIDSEKNQIRIYDQLGLRIPMNIGAANKVMLAFMPNNQAESIIKGLVPEEDKADFFEELKKIRQSGFGISHGERTEGTSSIAAPILNHFGEVQGAVSVGVVSFSLDEEGRLDSLIKNVVETCNAISSRLGFNRV